MQPTYLPWIGYFGLIDLADTFVFYDDVQFVKQSWQQRNRIKSPRGEIYLSIPIVHNFGQNINEVKIDNHTNWRKKHWESIRQSYAQAPHFNEWAEDIKGIYLDEWTYLYDLNVSIIFLISKLLNTHFPKFIRSSEISGLEGTSTDRLVCLLKKLEATEYISPIGSKGYMSNESFTALAPDIKLWWFEFQHPVYPQIRDNFLPYMAAIDLLFNAGSTAIDYIRAGTTSALKEY